MSTSAGKGSETRPTDLNKHDPNYDSIKWASKTVTEVKKPVRIRDILRKGLLTLGTYQT